MTDTITLAKNEGATPSTSAAVTSADQLIDRLKDLVPVFRERGPKTEEMRRLPDETINDLTAAGVFRALRPKAAGGLQLSVGDWVKMIRVASQGDASVGWLAGLLSAHAWQLTMLGKQAQDEIFGGEPTTLAVAVISQPGKAEKVDGGYKVNGRWTFASGSLHAQWAILLVFAEDGPLGCIVPMSQIIIHDTWKVAGMKATGSNDVEVKDFVVASHMTLPVSILMGMECPGADLYDYPLLRYPATRLLPTIHSAIALGVADAALELFPSLIDKRLRLHDRMPIVDDELTHEAFGLAAHERQCSELLIRRAVEMLDEAFGPGGNGLTLEQRAELNMANASAAHHAFAAIDLIVRAAGASIHRTGHALDRICRDTQVMRNHTLVDWRYHSATCGRVLLGRGPRPGDFQF